MTFTILGNNSPIYYLPNVYQYKTSVSGALTLKKNFLQHSAVPGFTIDINSYLLGLEKKIFEKTLLRTSTILRNINIDIIKIGILLRGQFNSLPENRHQLAKDNERLFELFFFYFFVCIGLEPFNCNKR